MKDYQALYLKYKFKYINLKKLVGAADPIKYEEDSKNIHMILKNIFKGLKLHLILRK